MKNDEKYGILFKSAIDLRKLICSKKISPVEITNLALERIEEINPIDKYKL